MNKNIDLSFQNLPTKTTIPTLLSQTIKLQEDRIKTLERQLERHIELFCAINNLDSQDYINTLNNDY